MNRFTSFLALLFLAPTIAFLTQTASQTRPHHSVCYAKKKGRQINVPKPLPTGPPPQDISMPEDCSMDDLLEVMGEGRLKKIGRKNRRKRNQKIREGKVVLNEKGEWVPIN
mmetsp:Transcript_578/g.817  ORF Transcript_578/g.817 Transcript_578/m.817 type:complete len:111 (-) Transcript_578:288-620(-)|eukprot:CAMPEP_0196142264 /NCGR_PEP_ID=MMETSP0910-20130528/11447_1 /TAXON_ID=49265 /ORGANISM="Thalassiosira rotula, Strain GSO102" /LENGTH=110 /DNA_ID=CAMNT_0041403561 /DNA_START=121 /DNA_END=453 /DNA_ORIENTATION=-